MSLLFQSSLPTIIVAFLLGLTSTASAAEKPNFVVIFCDDLGYSDIGCFGSQLHRTPRIDGLAEQGTRFTSFYVTSGVCTPSRASLNPSV